MHKVTINFAHANGFPAGSYKTLLNYLPSNINVIALEQYGHNDKSPVNHNWHAQVEELITFVESQQIDGNRVIAVGHSFGGVISFIACCQRPDLFSGLIMLDAPVLSGASALALGLLKKTRWIDKFSPAGKAKRRRTQWPLNADIQQAFSRRSLFKDFDERCLNDYIKFGIVQKNNKQELVFNANVEANIYRNLPSNLSTFKNKLSVPAILVYGRTTNVFPHHIFRRFIKLNRHIILKKVEGGHMFPMEYPEETAKLISEFIESLPVKDIVKK